MENVPVLGGLLVQLGLEILVVVFLRKAQEEHSLRKNIFFKKYFDKS